MQYFIVHFIYFVFKCFPEHFAFTIMNYALEASFEIFMVVKFQVEVS